MDFSLTRTVGSPRSELSATCGDELGRGGGFVVDPDRIGGLVVDPARGGNAPDAIDAVTGRTDASGGGFVVDPDRIGGGLVVDPDRIGGGLVVDPDRIGGGFVVDPDRIGGGLVVDPDRGTKPSEAFDGLGAAANPAAVLVDAGKTPGRSCPLDAVDACRTGALADGGYGAGALAAECAPPNGRTFVDVASGPPATMASALRAPRAVGTSSAACTLGDVWSPIG